MANDLSKSWLEANKLLRMDANDPLFPRSRRLFHISRYEFATKYCIGKNVLDGACGTGYGSAILGRVAKQVIGIDISENAIQYARNEYGAENIQFSVGCVELTNIEAESIDVVVSFETVEHTLCPRAHISEIARVLTSNGVAIISVPNGWGLSEHHFWDFDYDMLSAILQPRFSKIEYFYNNSDDNGEKPPGIGPLELSNQNFAECIIAVCSRVEKTNLESHRYATVMQEVYEGVFERHADYLRLKRALASAEIDRSSAVKSPNQKLRCNFNSFWSRVFRK